MNKDLFLPSNVSWFRLPDYVKAMYEAEVDNAATNLLAFNADGKPVIVESSSISGGGGGTDDQTAAEVPFDGMAAGLLATDVQAAIEEVQTTVDGFGSAAQSEESDFATAAQGALADSALQPAISGVVSNPATTLTPVAGSIAWAGTESNLYKATLVEASTLENASAPITDAVYQFIFTQDATGGRTLALGSNFRQADGVAPIDLSSAPANSKTIVTALYDGTVFMVTSVGNYPA